MRRGLAKARQGLLTADHSRRGRRCVTVLDPETLVVTVLEPWEHAVLVLCDGRRGARAIAALLPDVDGARADEAAVRGALDFLARQDLVTFDRAEAGPRPSSARPQSMAALQAAYEEWHKDPLRTSQILSARSPSPFGTDPLAPPPPSPKPAAPGDDEHGIFGDEPTLGQAPSPRAATERLPAAAPRRTPRAAARRVARRREAEDREVAETLLMGQALPRGRCPVCMAEMPEGARICPACRTRL